MDLKLLNKVAIITGASRGIGKVIAEQLAVNGAKIAIISRDLQSIEKVKNNVKSKDVICFEGDITNYKQFENIAKNINDNWGKIDILVNNAGITKDKILLRMSPDDWDSVINTNLKGCYNTIKIISKYMIKNRYGKIINISSVIGQIGNSGQSNYAASKSGLEGMTRSLAVELGSRNININCIAPGYIKTDMTQDLNENILKNFKQNIPLNRMGSSFDVANLVCYLSSDLSSYITGQVINIDGGITIK